MGVGVQVGVGVIVGVGVMVGVSVGVGVFVAVGGGPDGVDAAAAPVPPELGNQRGPSLSGVPGGMWNSR